MAVSQLYFTSHAGADRALLSGMLADLKGMEPATLSR